MSRRRRGAGAGVWIAALLLLLAPLTQAAAQSPAAMPTATMPMDAMPMDAMASQAMAPHTMVMPRTSVVGGWSKTAPDGPMAPAWAADTRFALASSTGRRVTDADYRGRFLLLQVVAGGCGAPCEAVRADALRAVTALGGEAGRVLFATVQAGAAAGSTEALHGAAADVRALLKGHGVDPTQVGPEGVLLLDDAYGAFVERLKLAGPQLTERLHRLLDARVTYLGVDEELWDYAPTHRDMMMDMPLNAHQQAYVYNNPQQIGSVYLKAIYHGYTDGTFKTRQPTTAQWRHLGILGPVIHAEVGDTLRVVLRNNGRRPYSLHVHGLRYDAASEGAMTAGAPGPFGIVPPGGTYTYVFDVPERAGPGPGDPSSIVWPYHSHVDEGADENGGLVGAVVVTRRGEARPDGSPKDVDREFVALFKIFDENRSPLLADNISRFTEPGRAPAGDLLDEDEAPADADTRAWIESNLKYAINGYIFGAAPGLDMHMGERVRWYLIGLGSETDLHTPHWHGNTAVVGGRRTDVVGLLPAQTQVADMVPDAVGTWMFHCHVVEHLDDGMTALYRVLPPGAPLSKETP